MFHKLLNTLHNPRSTIYNLSQRLMGPWPIRSNQKGSITLVLSAMILIGSLVGSVALSPITNFDTRQQAYDSNAPTLDGGSGGSNTCPTTCNTGQFYCREGKKYECIKYSDYCKSVNGSNGVWRFHSNDSCTANGTTTTPPSSTPVPSGQTSTGSTAPKVNRNCFVLGPNSAKVLACTKRSISMFTNQTCRQVSTSYFNTQADCDGALAAKNATPPPTTSTKDKPPENPVNARVGEEETGEIPSNRYAPGDCTPAWSGGTVRPGECDYRGSYNPSNPAQNKQICAVAEGLSYNSFTSLLPGETCDLVASAQERVNNTTAQSSQNQPCGGGTIAHNTFACADAQSCVLCINGVTQGNQNRSLCPVTQGCYQPEAPATQQTLCYSTGRDRCATGEPRDVGQKGPCESAGEFSDPNQCLTRLRTNESIAASNTARNAGACYFGVSSCSSLGREDLSFGRPAGCPSGSASYCGDTVAPRSPDPRCANATGVTPLNACNGNSLLVCDLDKQVAEVACNSGRTCQAGRCINPNAPVPPRQPVESVSANDDLNEADAPQITTPQQTAQSSQCWGHLTSADFETDLENDLLCQELGESQCPGGELNSQYTTYPTQQVCLSSNSLILDSDGLTVINSISDEANSCENGDTNYVEASDRTCNFVCTFPSNIPVRENPVEPPANSFFCTDTNSGNQRRVQCKPFFTVNESNDGCRRINGGDAVNIATNFIGGWLNNANNNDTSTEDGSETQTTDSGSFICNWIGLFCPENNQNNSASTTNNTQQACTTLGEFSCRTVPGPAHQRPQPKRHECMNLTGSLTWVNLESRCLGNEGNTEQSNVVSQNSEFCSDQPGGTISCRHNPSAPDGILSSHECVHLPNGKQWMDLGSACEHPEEVVETPIKPVYYGYTDELGNDNTISCLSNAKAQPTCASSTTGQDSASFECIQSRWIKISEGNQCTPTPQLINEPQTGTCSDGSVPREITVQRNDDGTATCYRRNQCDNSWNNNTDYYGQISLEECLEFLSDQLSIDPSNTPIAANVPTLNTCPGYHGRLGEVKYSQSLGACFRRTACSDSLVPTEGRYWARLNYATTEEECNQITYQQQANIAQASTNYDSEEEQARESDCWYHISNSSQNQCYRGFGNICTQSNSASFSDRDECERTRIAPENTETTNIQTSETQSSTTTCPAGQYKENGRDTGPGPCFIACTQSTEKLITEIGHTNDPADSFLCIIPEDSSFHGQCKYLFRRQGDTCVNMISSAFNNVINTIRNNQQETADIAQQPTCWFFRSGDEQNQSSTCSRGNSQSECDVAGNNRFLDQDICNQNLSGAKSNFASTGQTLDNQQPTCWFFQNSAISRTPSCFPSYTQQQCNTAGYTTFAGTQETLCNTTLESRKNGEELTPPESIGEGNSLGIILCNPDRGGYFTNPNQIPTLSESCFDQNFYDTRGDNSINQCVENSHNANYSCVCDSGYRQSGNRCVRTNVVASITNAISNLLDNTRQSETTPDNSQESLDTTLIDEGDTSTPGEGQATTGNNQTSTTTTSSTTIYCTAPTNLRVQKTWQSSAPANGFFCTDIANNQVYIQCQLFYKIDASGASCQRMNGAQIVSSAVTVIGNTINQTFDVFTNDENNDETPQTQDTNETVSNPGYCNVWFLSVLCRNQENNQTAEPVATLFEVCNDGIDNDANNQIDCRDTGCSADARCGLPANLDVACFEGQTPAIDSNSACTCYLKASGAGSCGGFNHLVNGAQCCAGAMSDGNTAYYNNCCSQITSDDPNDVTWTNTPDGLEDLPQTTQNQIAPFEDTILDASERYDVPDWMLAGLISRESEGNAELISCAGACGLMQILPSQPASPNNGQNCTGYTSLTVSGRATCDQLLDPVYNINNGAFILRQIYDNPELGNGDWRRTLALYNAGYVENLEAGNVRSHEGWGYADEICLRSGCVPTDTPQAQETENQVSSTATQPAPTTYPACSLPANTHLIPRNSGSPTSMERAFICTQNGAEYFQCGFLYPKKGQTCSSTIDISAPVDAGLNLIGSFFDDKEQDGETQVNKTVSAETAPMCNIPFLGSLLCSNNNQVSQDQVPGFTNNPVENRAIVVDEIASEFPESCLNSEVYRDLYDFGEVAQVSNILSSCTSDNIDFSQLDTSLPWENGTNVPYNDPNQWSQNDELEQFSDQQIKPAVRACGGDTTALDEGIHDYALMIVGRDNSYQNFTAHASENCGVDVSNTTTNDEYREGNF